MGNYPLNKTVYNSSIYKNVIDTSFTQVQPPAPPVEDTITVEEFFTYYGKIFYDIPTFGEINSHEYLIKTSGAYINISVSNDESQLLLDEITSLRQQLLESQRQLTNTQISSSILNIQ
jgi:hypothetical protein